MPSSAKNAVYILCVSQKITPIILHSNGFSPPFVDVLNVFLIQKGLIFHCYFFVGRIFVSGTSQRSLPDPASDFMAQESPLPLHDPKKRQEATLTFDRNIMKYIEII